MFSRLTNYICFFARLALLAVLLPVIFIPMPARADTGWYDVSWEYRKSITVDSAQVADSLSDFPLLISLSADIGLAANAQNDGDDILFTASDGITRRNHEIEEYESGSGKLAAWVKIPSLSDTQNTAIYMYYGNSGVSSQQNAAGVWSNGYEAVYHINDDFTDSAENHDAVNCGSVDIGGKIADGQEFIPVDEIQAGDWSVSGSAITIQAWVNPDDFNQDDPRVISKARDGHTNDDDHVFMLGLDGSGEKYVRGRIKTGTQNPHGTTTLVSSTNPLSADTWHLIALTYDGSNIKLFNNGTQVANTPKTGSLRENDWGITIGNNPDMNDSGYCSWDGKLDEIRVSSASRSSAWLATEYNNQNSPSSFYALGGEETPSSPPSPPAPVPVGGEVYPVNKLYVMSSWGGLMALLLIPLGAGVFILNKRKVKG